MVSALNSRSSGVGSSCGQGHCVVFLSKTHHSHSPSFPRMCKWVPTNLVLLIPAMD